ncbi:hypothetical protein BB558_005386 [Smittium angustum]|uniref:Uncharacterized protein n=1 Tax=Smittium angustum TaxID=133377 RepID=A0A2U1J0P1_SMIAN|nr:hypothetical protein BB558_005386 [Smittium angustum]
MAKQENNIDDLRNAFISYCVSVNNCKFPLASAPLISGLKNAQSLFKNIKSAYACSVEYPEYGPLLNTFSGSEYILADSDVTIEVIVTLMEYSKCKSIGIYADKRIFKEATFGKEAYTSLSSVLTMFYGPKYEIGNMVKRVFNKVDLALTSWEKHKIDNTKLVYYWMLSLKKPTHFEKLTVYIFDTIQDPEFYELVRNHKEIISKELFTNGLFYSFATETQFLILQRCDFVREHMYVNFIKAINLLLTTKPQLELDEETQYMFMIDRQIFNWVRNNEVVQPQNFLAYMYTLYSRTSTKTFISAPIISKAIQSFQNFLSGEKALDIVLNDFAEIVEKTNDYRMIIVWEKLFDLSKHINLEFEQTFQDFTNAICLKNIKRKYSLYDLHEKMNNETKHSKRNDKKRERLDKGFEKTVVNCYKLLLKLLKGVNSCMKHKFVCGMNDENDYQKHKLEIIKVWLVVLVSGKKLFEEMIGFLILNNDLLGELGYLQVDGNKRVDMELETEMHKVVVVMEKCLELLCFVCMPVGSIGSIENLKHEFVMRIFELSRHLPN